MRTPLQGGSIDAFISLALSQSDVTVYGDGLVFLNASIVQISMLI